MTFRRLGEFLCRRLCGARLFNSGMSAEIDRLTVENELLKEEIAAVKERVGDPC